MGFSLPLQTKTTLTMITLKELYRIGYGPSSSHTMAPRKAATLFLERNPKAVRFEVTLYGSLAATGKGHMTDKAILDVLDEPRTTIIWKPKTFLPSERHEVLRIRRRRTHHRELDCVQYRRRSTG